MEGAAASPAVRPPPTPAEAAARAADVLSSAKLGPGDLKPRKWWKPQSAEETAKITHRDERFLALATLNEKGLVPMDNYNGLLDGGIGRIFQHQFWIQKRFSNMRKSDTEIVAVDMEVRFSQVEIHRPTRTGELGTTSIKLPSHARRSRAPPAGNLAAPLRLTVETTLKPVMAPRATTVLAPVTARAEGVTVGEIPILVRSNRCHTHLMPPTVLREVGEDPEDPGGYAIIGGNEYSVQNTENIVYNSILCHLRPMTGVLAQAQFISQAGGAFDNSSQLTVQHLPNGALILNLSSQQKLKTERIPFYVVARLLGAANDHEIVAPVVFDEVGLDGSPVGVVAQQMLDWLEGAYQADYKEFSEMGRITNHRELVLAAAERMMGPSSEAPEHERDPAYRYQQLMSVIDGQLIPHMGTGPEARPAKLRIMGLMIRRLFQVEMGSVAPTDRDSYEFKRVHDAGITVAKAMKRAITDGVIKPLYDKIQDLLKTNAFAAIRPSLLSETVRNTFTSAQLTRNVAQAITSGYRTGGRKGGNARPVRLKSQTLERKNSLNTVATLRTIHTQGSSDAKHTQRGTDRRQVHAASTGFICAFRSADTGEAVGMTKEQSISAHISWESDPLILKAALRADPELRPFADTGYAPYSGAGGSAPLTLVFINGDWIGGVADPQSFVERYRHLRREGRVVPSTVSISWAPTAGQIAFHVDAGRLLRPLLLVDNNQKEFDAAARSGKPVPFTQGISATREHLAGLRTGRLRLDDLIAAGVVEWVSPEEQVNSRIAEDLSTLRAARHDVLRPYTHVDIPMGLLSLTALANVLPEFSQPARWTYSTNQMRQAAGPYVADPSVRMDNGRFWMPSVDRPLLCGLSHNLVKPAGLNVPVGYYCLGGWGQEDSAILNEAFVRRQGFAGSFFVVVRAERRKGEQYAPPDPAKCARLKPDTNYAKLGASGFPAAGTIIEKGDAVIGMVGQNTGPDHEKWPHVDISVSWSRDERARVVTADPSTGGVYLEIYRPMGVGDKSSSRSGNKGIGSVFIPVADLPFSRDGAVAAIIVNPHSFPTRMILSQIIEATMSSAGARLGLYGDGTAWSGVTIEAGANLALRSGLSVKNGRQLSDPTQGLPLRQSTHVGLTYEQRLLKFALDEGYAAPASGPRDPVTAQPVPGKAAGGAVRLGEMENWTLMVHGNPAIIQEKQWLHSDGLYTPHCRRCGTIAVHNPASNLYTCLRCRDAADLVETYSRRSAVAFEHEIGSVVSYQVHPRPRTYVGSP